MTKFQVKLDELIKNLSWFKEIDDVILLELFKQESEENIQIIYEYLLKYSLDLGNTDRQYHILLKMIKYLANNNLLLNDSKIITALKKQIDEHINLEKPEYTSSIIDAISQIVGEKEKKYFIQLYNSIKSKGKLYPDINCEFLEVFMKHGNNQLFVDCFSKVILDNNYEIHFSDLTAGFKYLCKLNTSKFRSTFISILEIFKDINYKKGLIYYHNYTSLIKDSEYYEDTIQILIKKIDTEDFVPSQRKKMFEYLCTETSFALENHCRDLLKIPFIKILSDYIFLKNKYSIIDLLKNIDTENLYIYGLESYVINYINKDLVGELISILFYSDKNKNILYYIYDRIIYSDKENKQELIDIFESNDLIGAFIKKRNKHLEEQEIKNKRHKLRKKGKEKAEIFAMLTPGKGKYFPKLLHDYIDYLDRKNLDILFKKEEIQKIENSVKDQVLIRLNGLSFKEYSQDIIRRITYESKGDGSFTISGEISVLNWIIKISIYLNIDIYKYSKIFILYYPLLFGDPKLENIFKLIKTPDKDDIDYFLLVYSEDIHDNAKGLRFYNPQNIYPFYCQYKSHFTKKQKQKLVDICINIIENQDLYRVYSVEDYFDIISNVKGKTFIKKLWNTLYLPFNYFTDILNKNEDYNDKESTNLKTLYSLNTHLIAKYNDRTSILWRIRQLKDGVVECSDSFKIEYPFTSTGVHGISRLESELGWGGNNQYNFSYVFSQIGKIDVCNKMIDLLVHSFSLQTDIISGKISPNFQMYCEYLKKVFFLYIENLDESLKNKKMYFIIREKLMLFDYKITSTFNFKKLRECFGIDEIMDEAHLIYKQGPNSIANLLMERQLLLDNPIKIIVEKPSRWEKDIILFVEGETDIIILENAWRALYPEKRDVPFQIENGFDCHHIGRGFKEKDYGFLSSIQNKKLIGMLDYDSAYGEFNRLLDISDTKWNLVQDSDALGRLVKHSEKEGYVFLLPVPEFRKDYASDEYKEKSMLSIELLFKDQYLEGYVNTIKLPGGISLLKMIDSKKNKFSSSTSSFPKEAFTSFEAIFNLISRIKDGEYY
ncbi:MAG: hypothetical protein PHZ26_04450 [Candidatus Gracilibacteria bacterium]|nr:hypothetical protein [Candidatus Gracilibacteria bacterium]MDD2908979.1 hypothetical protein [Candidatus Gracilibacteria bacterium]